MNGFSESLLRMTMGIPREGERATFQKGPLSLLIESHRGGLCVRTPHGNDLPNDQAADPRTPPKRHFLGLPKDGYLELAVRSPDYRVRVHLTDRLTVVPDGRLRGYLTVPLPHRLSWRRPDGRTDALLEVAPKELRTAWLGEGALGGYIHDAHSAFHIDRRGVRADTVALVPVVIINHSDHVLSPEVLTISILDRDIQELDGQIITSPRRLHFGEEAQFHERIRSIPRRSA